MENFIIILILSLLNDGNGTLAYDRTENIIAIDLPLSSPDILNDNIWGI